MLATVEDYIPRHGDPENPVQTHELLADASSLVRQVARIHISRVVDDEIVLDGDGTRRIFLPNIPVIDVASVEIDAVPLDPDAYRWWRWGGLDRRDGRAWPSEPDSVVVVCTHGEDPTPEWIVNLVCAMVQRATRPAAESQVQQQTTGSQSIIYVSASGGVSLWLTQAEADRLEALRGPALA